jgi:hypothetical protein
VATKAPGACAVNRASEDHGANGAKEAPQAARWGRVAKRGRQAPRACPDLPGRRAPRGR